MAILRIDLRMECRPCLQVNRWASTACTPLLLFMLCGVAHADNALEQWRDKVGETRLLAENDTKRAYAEAERLQAELPSDATPSDRVRLLNLLARIENYQGETEISAAHAQQAFDLAKQHDDRAGQAEADITIALDAVNQGNIDAMIAADTHSMAILDGVDRPDLLAEVMLRGSMMYNRLEMLDESVAIAVQAMEIARRGNDDWVLAYAYQGMAVAYDLNGRHTEARDNYAEMLKHARAAHSKILEGSALLGVGTMLGNLGDSQAGEQLIKQSITLYRTAIAPFYLGRSLYILAENMRKLGQVAESVRILDEVAAIYEQRHNKIGLWWTLLKRSSNYQDLGKIAQADADAKDAYRLAKEINFTVYLSKSAQRLSAIHAFRGDYREAYLFGKEAEDLSAKVVSDKAGKRMLELTKRYETESKQREIDKLNRRNQQQATELAHRALEQRWLWTVLGGSVIMLTGTGFFLVRLRRSHSRLAKLNTEVSQAKNKLQATLDTIPDLMFEVGLDGRYYDCHSPRSELLVAPIDILLTKTVSDVMPANAAAVYLETLNEAHQHGHSLGKQLLLPLPHGDFWFELSAAQKPGDTGEEPRFIVMSRDITERKRMEATTLQREQEFRVLVENSPDLIFRYDKNCRRIYANPAVARLVGRPSDALLNSTPSEAKILSDEEADRLMRVIRQVLATGGAAESEVACMGADGLLHYFHNRYAPEFNGHGNVVGVISIARDITERKRAEEALIAREREFRTLAESLPDNIVRYDLEGRVIYVNPVLEKTLGTSASKMLGTTVRERFPNGEYDDYAQLLDSVLASGEDGEIEKIVAPSNGKLHLIHNIRMIAEHDENGEVSGALGIGRDITERKQAEHDIALMSEALGKVHEAAYIMDNNARFLYINDESCRALGYSRDELLALSVMDIGPGWTLEMVREVWQYQRDTGTVQSFEASHRRKDGSIFPVEINANQFEYDGKMYGLALVRDITDRKLAENEIRTLNASLEQRVLERTEELRRQTHYLRTLIDTLPMLAWLKDTDSRFLVVNQAIAMACNLSVDDMVGKSDLDCWPREYAEAYRSADAEVMATGQRKTVEEPFVDGHNGATWVETFKAPVLDEDGSVLGTVGIARDISGRKAMEQAREGALAEAKRLAKLRSEFMARMSHELRTPLNGILGYSQILLGENRGNERQSAMLNVIQQSGDYLLNLINDILDFAKIEAGKQELNLSNVSLPRFLRNIAGIITIKAEQKALVFVCDVAADVPAGIRADETRLRQVLLNLLSNAVKYSERGKVSLRVTVLEKPSPEGEGAHGLLRFEVQDNGIGIDAGQLETIFRAFEQAGDRLHRTGTGLGLPISRELVKLMGSDIQVSSRVGEGSTFWFDLDVPVVEFCGDIMADEQHVAGYQGLRRRVLVVDDVNENRALVIDILSRLGFETFEAANGRECLNSVETQTPDLILLDMVMPEMDGLETARCLRRLPGFGQTPIIAVSASASDCDVAEAMKAGVNVFLSKPIDIKRLMAQLAVLLKIDWIYALPETGELPQQRLNESLVVPPLEEMNILHRLAQEGSMRDIIRQAAHIEGLDQRYRPFAAQLRALAQGYQSKAILDLVERYINRVVTIQPQIDTDAH